MDTFVLYSTNWQLPWLSLDDEHRYQITPTGYTVGSETFLEAWAERKNSYTEVNKTNIRNGKYLILNHDYAF